MTLNLYVCVKHSAVLPVIFAHSFEFALWPSFAFGFSTESVRVTTGLTLHTAVNDKYSLCAQCEEFLGNKLIDGQIYLENSASGQISWSNSCGQKRSNFTHE